MTIPISGRRELYAYKIRAWLRKFRNRKQPPGYPLAGKRGTYIGKINGIDLWSIPFEPMRFESKEPLDPESLMYLRINTVGGSVTIDE